MQRVAGGCGGQVLQAHGGACDCECVTKGPRAFARGPQQAWTSVSDQPRPRAKHAKHKEMVLNGLRVLIVPNPASSDEYEATYVCAANLHATTLAVQLADAHVLVTDTVNTPEYMVSTVRTVSLLGPNKTLINQQLFAGGRANPPKSAYRAATVAERVCPGEAGGGLCRC